MWKCQCVCVESPRKGDQGENTCRLMARPHSKALLLSVNHHKWLQSLVLMTLALYTNEAKGFVKGPNCSGSSDETTWSKYSANEPQRSISVQQGENYRVIPTFYIITIFMALLPGQEPVFCIVSSLCKRNLNSLFRRDQSKSTYVFLFIFPCRLLQVICMFSFWWVSFRADSSWF